MKTYEYIGLEFTFNDFTELNKLGSLGFRVVGLQKPDTDYILLERVISNTTYSYADDEVADNKTKFVYDLIVQRGRARYKPP